MVKAAIKKYSKACMAFPWMKIPHIRNALTPASGTGQFYPKSAKSLRMVKRGCSNRPFYQIVAMERRRNQYDPVIEQVGSYDPIPNKMEQIMVALNYERIRHWIGSGAHITRPVSELLGLAGILPIYPKTYMNAWRNRLAAAREAKEASAEKSEESEKQ